MFSLGMLVEYRNHCGIIDFIDSSYLIIRLPPSEASEGRQSPRLIVHPEYQDEIKVLKDSER